MEGKTCPLLVAGMMPAQHMSEDVVVPCLGPRCAWYIEGADTKHDGARGDDCAVTLAGLQVVETVYG